MKKLTASITLTLLLIASSAWANCGIQPTIPPISGCNGQMVAVCICDDYFNCYWIWVCQPYN